MNMKKFILLTIFLVTILLSIIFMPRSKEHAVVILADEISPDTCRLWDVDTNEKLDKDRFRRNLGDLVQGYQEVLTRMNNN